MPIAPIREKVNALLNTEKGKELWRGEVNVVQVTNCSEETIEIRCLVDVHNSPDGWELRVFLREELIKFIQDEYPQCLPKTRASLLHVPEEMTKTSSRKDAA